MSIVDHVDPHMWDWISTDYVATESGCWEWTRSKATAGYGTVLLRLPDGSRPVARVTRIIVARELGRDLRRDEFVCHKCDNPPCINPEHLFLGSPRDNARDMAAKGRHAQQSKTHCANGHKFTEENTRWRKTGWRECVTCAQLANAARWGRGGAS